MPIYSSFPSHSLILRNLSYIWSAFAASFKQQYNTKFTAINNNTPAVTNKVIITHSPFLYFLSICNKENIYEPLLSIDALLEHMHDEHFLYRLKTIAKY